MRGAEDDAGRWAELERMKDGGKRTMMMVVVADGGSAIGRTQRPSAFSFSDGAG